MMATQTKCRDHRDEVDLASDMASGDDSIKVVPVDTPMTDDAIIREVETITKNAEHQFRNSMQRWKVRFEGLEKQLKEQDGEIDSLKLEIERLKDALSSSENKSKKEKLQGELKTKEKELKRKIKELNEMKERERQLESKIKASKDERDTAISQAERERILRVNKSRKAPHYRKAAKMGIL